jgi:hypothetical protein
MEGTKVGRPLWSGRAQWEDIEAAGSAGRIEGATLVIYNPEAPVECVSNTAARIPMSAAECAAFGRAWKDQDIKTTGATEAAQALRLLDAWFSQYPSVTVTGQ